MQKDGVLEFDEFERAMAGRAPKMAEFVKKIEAIQCAQLSFALLLTLSLWARQTRLTERPLTARPVPFAYHSKEVQADEVQHEHEKEQRKHDERKKKVDAERSMATIEKSRHRELRATSS